MASILACGSSAAGTASVGTGAELGAAAWAWAGAAGTEPAGTPAGTCADGIACSVAIAAHCPLDTEPRAAQHYGLQEVSWHHMVTQPGHE